jgi:hypothetical protein
MGHRLQRFGLARESPSLSQRMQLRFEDKIYICGASMACLYPNGQEWGFPGTRYPPFQMAKQYIPPATWSPVSTNSNGGNFTFTSPAVYVAHRSIDRIVYISSMDVHWPTTFVWGTVTRVRTAGIIPIAASDVFPARSASSLLTASGVEYAQLVANGSYIPMLDRQPHKKRYTYEPMTFGDLEEPMPASLYYNARSIDFWGKQSHWNNNGTRISAQATPRPIGVEVSVWRSHVRGPVAR